MTDPILEQIDASIARGPNPYHWDPESEFFRLTHYRDVRERWIRYRPHITHPAVLAVFDLHQPDEDGECSHCITREATGVAWPCTTALALLDNGGVQ